MSLVISHIFLSYFIPARELIQVVQGSPAEHMTAFTFILIFTAIIYFDFAFFREQLCLIICPYGRLQSALYDRDTVQVGYDRVRGEPRGHYKDEQHGSCIDCYRCVAVCPTGIDIRNGTQMECIGCSNCIDACDEVMARVGEEPGLIRYDSERAFNEGKETRRFLRPRLFAYLGAVILLFGLFTFMAGQREPFDARPVRLEGPAYILAGDQILNRYRIHLVNKLGGTQTFTLTPINASDSLIYELGETEVTLTELEGTNVAVVVKIPREAYKPGMQLQIDVRSGETVVRATAPLSGPAN
jgi:cytochrome c oxidase accessory protein FixG